MPQIPRFKNQSLLQTALTHSSYANENPSEGEDNERLEFLGDATLGFIVGSLLYRTYPNMAEGELTRRRSLLVDKPKLAEIATSLDLGQHLRLGVGIKKDGGHQSASVLSCAFEALIGAYLLDSGIEATQAYVETLFIPLLEHCTKTRSLIDPKTQFQQWVQANLGHQVPSYKILDAVGPDHDKSFKAAVSVGTTVYGIGIGKSKKAAEKQAAEAALKKLGEA